MKKGSAVISMLVVVFAMVQILVVKSREAAITCGQVDSSLAFYISYLTAGENPVAACYVGLKDLQAITPTTTDKRAACDCVKAAAARNPNIKEDAVSSLPTKCGVQMDIPISKTTNCANIN